MVISKFIYIPLLLLVPLTILFFESRSKDFTQPPSDQEVADQVEQWKATKPSLQQSEASPATPPEEVRQPSTPEPAEAPEKAQAQPVSPKAKDATQAIDLKLTPELNYLQGIEVKRLKLLIQQLDPNLHPELIYLANERILDSAHDSSLKDIHAAGAYLNQHPRPLWNPEPSTRLPLKVLLKVDTSHYQKATALAQKIKTSIFWGSGGTVQPEVLVQKTASAKSTITLTGKNGSITSVIPALDDTEKMLGNAIQLAVTQAVNDNKLSILHTDQIHYTYFSRLTWQLLAKSL